MTGHNQVEYFEKDLSFDEFSIEFFKVYKDIVRIHVYEKNQKHYNNHIKPYFAKHILKEIQPLELKQWQLKLLKKYKPSTVVKYRSVMYSIFDKALQNNLVKYNPLSRVKSPLTIKKKIRTLTENEDENVNPFTIKEIKKYYLMQMVTCII